MRTPTAVRTATLFRGMAPRLSLALAVAAGALIILIAIYLGEQRADRAVKQHEQLIGDDLVLSVDQILDRVVSGRRPELAALAGQPCLKISRALAELETHLRYVRAVALVSNGHLYCSSALGPIDKPLSTYLRPSARGDSMALLAQTPYQPGVPVIAIYSPAGGQAGVLYVVEADYLADALAHGVRLGAGTAALATSGLAFLDDHGRFLTEHYFGEGYATVASRVWPVAVLVSSSQDYILAKHWKCRLAFGAVGVLLAALVAAGYLLAFAPRRLLLNAVRHALRRGEFHVVYQPIVAIASRSVVGVEALIRWHHPKWGPISPAAFMAEVEASELLTAVTRFVLKTAVADMSLSPPVTPLHVAINIAPGDLERKGFAAEVIALNRQLPSGSCLVLELTERFLLSESARVVAVFQALKANGIRFAIDDFGTEHSNLDRISRFPFDYVKVDRQFVNQADTGGADLINGIVSVARHFDLQVIAEGVETEAQHEALLAAGVPYAQGYLYGRPVRLEQMEMTRRAQYS